MQEIKDCSNGIQYLKKKDVIAELCKSLIAHSINAAHITSYLFMHDITENLSFLYFFL